MSLRKKYSNDNPAYRARPGLKFAFSHPAHMVALFFGAGCMRPGPGTWGTLAGVITWIGLVQFMPWQALLAGICAMFVVGAICAEKTGKDLGLEDAGCIVIDEVVAVWLVCLMLPQTPAGWIAAFVSFRIFDIVKLPPASIVDERMHSGWGVMVDDILAAFWALLSVILVDWFVNRIEPFGWVFLGVW